MAKRNQNKKFDMNVFSVHLQEVFSKKNSFKILYLVLAIATVVLTAFAIYFGLMQFSLHSGGFKFFLIFMLFIWGVPSIIKSILKSHALSEDRKSVV